MWEVQDLQSTPPTTPPVGASLTSLVSREAPSRGSWKAWALGPAPASRGLTGLEARRHLSWQVTEERQEVPVASFDPPSLEDREELVC